MVSWADDLPGATGISTMSILCGFPTSANTSSLVIPGTTPLKTAYDGRSVLSGSNGIPFASKSCDSMRSHSSQPYCSLPPVDRLLLRASEICRRKPNKPSGTANTSTASTLHFSKSPFCIPFFNSGKPIRQRHSIPQKYNYDNHRRDRKSVVVLLRH